jgi:hypothetical protein
VRLAALTLAAGAALGCSDGQDERWALWSYVSPALFQPNCATSSCHSEATAVAGLNFSTVKDGYASLTDLKLPRRGKEIIYPRPLVTPFDPDQSRLINVLRGNNVRRMPPDRPFSEVDILLVEQWILNGARND